MCEFVRARESFHILLWFPMWKKDGERDRRKREREKREEGKGGGGRGNERGKEKRKAKIFYHSKI